MNSADRSQVHQALLSHCHAIADRWYQAIVRTRHAPHSAAKVQQRLVELTEQAIALLFAEPFERGQAQAIGASLAGLRYIEPQVLSRTQELLTQQLIEGLPADQVVALQPRLAELLGGLAAGFSEQACETILSEQEQTHAALTAALRQAKEAVQRAYEEVEQRVQERTTDLLAANEQLKREITERKRAEVEIRRRNKELKAVSDVAYAVNRSLGLQSTMTIGVREILQVVGGEAGCIFLLEGEPPRWTIAAWEGIDQELFQSLEDAIQGDEPWPSAEESASDVFVLQSLSDKIKKTMKSAGFQALNVLPLQSRVGMLGVTVLAGREERLLGLQSVKALMTIAEQLSTAIENAQLYQEAQRELAERVQAEEALYASAQQWRATFDAIANGISLLDQEGGILRCNQALIDILGKPFSEIIGRTYWKLIHGTSEPIEGCPVVRMQQTRHREAIVLQRGDCWFNVVADPVLDEDGRLIGAVHIMIDITERKQAEEALQESEERFRGIFENATIGLYRTTPGGRILMANPALVRMLGYSSFEELTERNLEDRGFEPKYPRSAFKQRIESEGQVFGLESAWVRRDGATLFIRENTRATRDETGNTLYYEGTVEDITERKQAEEALRQAHNELEMRVQERTAELAHANEALQAEINERKRAEEELIRLSSAVKTSVDSIVIIDAAGKIIDVNEATLKMYGADDKGELIGQDSLNLLAPEYREEGLAGIEAVLEKGYDHSRDYEAVTKDSHRVPVEMSAAVMKDAAGKPIGIVIIARDITERKRVEEELRDREATARALLNAPIESAILLDTSGTILALNATAAKSLGKNADELVGLCVYDILPTAVAKFRKTQVDRVFHSGAPVRFEDARGGRLFDHSLYPILDARGKVARIAVYVRDITHRKRAEERLRVYQAQLRSLASQLSLTEEQERRRIAMALHDRVGQTLAISKMKLGALRQSASSTELAGPLDEIHEFIEEIIRDTRSLTLELSSPILYELGLEAAVEWLTEQTQHRHGILFEFWDDRQPKPLDDDVRVLLFQAVRELLVNVAKHAQARSVKVSTRRDGGDVRIIVEDDGVGFDTFPIGSQWSRIEGFGLFSIRERLEHIGGRLEVESKSGHGTRVTLVAPLKRDSQ